ncbi:MAG TPA: DUF72 domain-containing protein [Rhizomicrobium sp.]
MLWIGTAGWAIRREHAGQFESEGSHLARYAARLNAAEINSSFYRPHRPATYARWARETPEDFRFAVKLPRAITHDARLKNASLPLRKFLGECGALEEKLGCILIQLPPSLKWDKETAQDFFAEFREAYAGAAALEPRHESWFTNDADKMLSRFRIARVAADPIPAKMKHVAQAAEPGGFDGFRYWRLHGSPRIYYSNYESEFLRALAKRLAKEARTKDVWCIFDNTALGHATANALEMMKYA